MFFEAKNAKVGYLRAA